MDKKIKKVAGNKGNQGVLTSKISAKNINDEFSTQAISQPDKRQAKTGVALPVDENGLS